jgi:hypothetical protein
MPACFASIHSKVNHPVSTFNDIQVVLNNKNGVSTVRKSVESGKQVMDVVKMKASRGLIKNEQNGLVSSLPGQEAGQLDALSLTSAELIEGWPSLI